MNAPAQMGATPRTLGISLSGLSSSWRFCLNFEDFLFEIDTYLLTQAIAIVTPSASPETTVLPVFLIFSSTVS